MAEKVIHELRIIETDDGYRIEIKGDKEQLKKMGIGQMFRPHGFGRFGRGWGRHGGRGGLPFLPHMPYQDDEASQTY